MLQTRKVGIVGAGHVGAHVALALLQSGEADDIVLIDAIPEKAAAQAMDLSDCVSGSLCGRDTRIRVGGYEELQDADVLVIAFGRSRRPGETRLDMFDDSIRMAKDVITQLRQVHFPALRSAFQIRRILFVSIYADRWAGRASGVFVRGRVWKHIGCCVFYRSIQAAAAVLYRDCAWVNMATPALLFGRMCLCRDGCLRIFAGTIRPWQ